MQRKIGFLLGAVLLITLLCNRGSVSSQGGAPPPVMAQGTNLLINGNMDGGNGQWPFYWRPPNHFVAGMWYEWFWTGAIPEFIDGMSPHHNVCYPPSPNWDQRCEIRNNHSQGYIRWGAPFVAGIYQPVSAVTPCTLYRFEAYNTNQGPNYHTRVGIDPTGQVLPPYIPPDGDDLPRNCPPDYRSHCPNPGVSDPSRLPPNIVWSAEYNGVAWAPLSVTAEAVNTTISVWTYAAPEPLIESVSTYWDEAWLEQVPFPDGRLPAPASWTPSNFIQNLSVVYLLDRIIVTWETPQPASSQVWYRRPPFTTVLEGEYAFATPLDATPKTMHRVVIEGLSMGETVDLIALSRRVTGNRCATEVSEPQTVALPDRLPPDSWTPGGFVQNLTVDWLLDKVIVSWQTPEPATTQVWYDISPTTPPSASLQLAEPTYRRSTPLDIALVTHHTAVIEGFQSNETIRLVALSARVIGDRISTDVSEERVIAIPARAPQPETWRPSEAIQNLTARSVLDLLIVEWETPAISSTTQVWYNIYPPPPPPPPPPTGTLSFAVRIYLPLVQSSPPLQYDRATDFDLRLKSQHRAVIHGLKDGEGISFRAISAHIVDGRIVTELSEPQWVRVSVPAGIRRIYLPIALRGL